MRRDSGDWLARYQAGDPQALDELVAAMGPRLKGYFLRQGAQEPTAEDLTQNVFVRVLQGAEHYRPSGRLEPYLLRIARNLWIDHRRRRRPATWREDRPEPADPQPGPPERAAESDRAERLRAALAACEPATRELLELAVLQRLPYREVGDMLNIPVGTVKSRVFYALRRLRGQLAELQTDEARPGRPGPRGSAAGDAS